MTAEYRIFGAELSPYSVKVRSYFRYKGIAHQWLVRGTATEKAFQQHAKLPIVPLVVSPQGESLQDSTPIIEALEARQPEPGIHPEDPVAAFASVLLEEFGDEWANKWMFHLRWAREVDQIATSRKLAYGFMGPGAALEVVEKAAGPIRQRMVPRVSFVGSNPATAPLIEESFLQGLALLDTHLQQRPYLFGQRPSFGDFGLWGQIYSAWLDPTAFCWVQRYSPALMDWIQRMLFPTNSGLFESWESLAPTMTPILSELVAGQFLPWSVANAAALGAGEPEFSVELPLGQWTQAPVKYQAKSLAALREKYRALAGHTGIEQMLRETGCLPHLQGA